MHDINFIRNNPIEFDNSIKKRGEKPCSDVILKIDEEKRKAQTHLQELLNKRNTLSKEIGILKSKNQNADKTINDVEKLKDQISSLKELEKIKDDELKSIISKIPNMPSDDVKVGLNDTDNIEFKKWGNKPKFSFKPRHHFEIGEKLGLMDFNVATKLSGSRFVVLKGILAKLKRESILGLEGLTMSANELSHFEQFLELPNSVFHTNFAFSDMTTPIVSI